MKKPLFLLTLLLCCCLVGKGQEELTFKIADGAKKDVPAGMKMDQSLYDLFLNGSSDLTTNPTKNGPQKITEEKNHFSSLEGVRFDQEGKVLIDAASTSSGEELLAALEKLGLSNGSTFKRVVSGYLPVASLEMLGEIDVLRFAKASKATLNIGSVDNEADVALRSDVAKSLYGLNGTGIKIGVLSDAYNALGGEAAGIASGDLPGPGNPNGFTTPVTILKDLTGGGLIDEGRGMIELIHDIVPAAEIFFYTAFDGEADFANGIIALQAAGCQVIVDDVRYFFEPYFQDGIIAQAVDSVTSLGASYYSSAGNAGSASYEAPFNPSGAGFFGEEAHDFDPGPGVDIFQEIRIPAFRSTTWILQWVDNYFSLNGAPGAATDINIYIIDAALTTVLGAFTADQSGGDPATGLTLSGLSDGFTFNLVITNGNAGPNPPLIKWTSSSRFISSDPIANTGTSYGHSNAAGANGTGAVFYLDSPEFGQDPPLPEPFTSLGGVPIYFDQDGNFIGKTIREKPEFSAIDGTNTTFFGQDVEGDGNPNFFGTSAAAPHAAAVAALMQEYATKTTGPLTPARITRVLRRTAIDMETPGYDFLTGAGLIQADAAIKELIRQNARVTRFILVDAEADTNVVRIRDGDVLLLEDLPEKFNIIAITQGSQDIDRVMLDLNGPVENERTEKKAPYAVFGDSNGDYSGRYTEAGAYDITAVPYFVGLGGLEQGCELMVNFTIVDCDISGPIVNAGPDKSLDCTSGDVMLMGSVSGGVGTVTQSWRGPGGFMSNMLMPTVSVPGIYTLRARDENGCRATSQVLVDPCLETCTPQILRFVLVDSRTDEDIMRIRNGAMIDFLEVGRDLNVRADLLCGDNTESVKFELTGAQTRTRTENKAPYALAGDSDGDYSDQEFLPGMYTLSATGYTGNNATGVAGATRTINFEFMNGTPAMAFEFGDPSATPDYEISAFPNPAIEQFQLEMKNFEEGTYQARLLDVTGRVVLSEELNVDNVNLKTFDFQTSNISTGLYILTVQRGSFSFRDRIFIGK
ncbi:MAG: T9SS type A sorting domain-containing protein [Bacteroidota bacterium]